MELLWDLFRHRYMERKKKGVVMMQLQKLRQQVNKAYSEALECRCHIKKRQLLKKFYEMNKQYNQHKDWIETIEVR